MINQPKDATSCNFLNVDGIIKEVELYSLSGNTSQLYSLGNLLGLPVHVLVAGTECKAKPFGVPLRMKIFNTDAYVVDARQVTSISNAFQYKVTNSADFSLLGLIGIMSAIWDSTDNHMVKNAASDLAPIYANWLAATISSAFNLALDQRTEIQIVAAYFYWTLLQIEDDKNKIAARIAVDIKTDFDRVANLLDGVEELNTLESFVAALKTTSAGVRLDRFDVATLYQVSTGVWTGAAGRTHMEVALEHPAYILALTATALTERSYRRARFAEYVSLFDRRPEIKQLPLTVKHITQSA